MGLITEIGVYERFSDLKIEGHYFFIVFRDFLFIIALCILSFHPKLKDRIYVVFLYQTWSHSSAVVA